MGLGSEDLGKDGFALVIYIDGGDEFLRRRCSVMGQRGGVVEGGEGVGEDGAVGGGEGGDEGGGDRVVEGGPRGGADVMPEVVFGAEAAEVGCGGGGGGEGCAVESGEDVGLDDVRMDGGDGWTR